MILSHLLTVKVPGKLMVAGEYAVLEKNQPLVVMAVNRFVYAKIEKSETNRLTLGKFGLFALKWEKIDNKIHIDTENKHVLFVEQAMTLALGYLNEQGIYPDPFTLTVESELDDTSGIKYGLGSSAAVVTAVVSAILTAFSSENPTDLLVFKTAAIAHVTIQGSGSGADIAASVYGGLLEYSAFQAQWVIEAYEKADSITDLIMGSWPSLSIEKLALPTGLELCIGWTKDAASTAAFIKQIKHLKTENMPAYEDFLNKSRQAVQTFLFGIKNSNFDDVFTGIKNNRLALSRLGKVAGANIETALLEKLALLAEQFDGAGKLSGAGGGDCGIAFVTSKDAAKLLKQLWLENGIKPLEITLQYIGAEATDHIDL